MSPPWPSIREHQHLSTEEPHGCDTTHEETGSSEVDENTATHDNNLLEPSQTSASFHLNDNLEDQEVDDHHYIPIVDGEGEDDIVDLEAIDVHRVNTFKFWYHDPPAYFEDLEFLEMYRPGGYHPVLINDILDGRFEVVHKLGDSVRATIWLCMDTLLKEWNAIKIFTAYDSSEECPDLKFSVIIGHSRFVALPKHYFWIDGPNGRHLALVLPFLGPSIMEVQELPSSPAAIYNVCCEMVEALHYLHTKGICHGNFAPYNMLHRMRNINTVTKEEMWELLGTPFSPYTCHFINRTEDGISGHALMYVVLIADRSKLQHWISEDEIAIIDFAHAFKTSDPPRRVNIPHPFFAPEMFLGEHPRTTSDIWSLAYSIFLYQTNWEIPDDLTNAIRCI